MSSVNEALVRAVARHQSGDLGEAERLYCEVLRIDPRHADALHLLGVVSHQRGRNDRAVELIRRAIDVDTQTAAYHANLGSVYYALGQSEQAIASYEQAIRLDPQSSDVHFNLANVHFAAGRLDEARHSYEAELRVCADHADAWTNLGKISAAQQQMAEAVRCFEHAVQLRPDFADGHLSLGQGHQALGQRMAAVASFRRAVKWAPNSGKAHNHLGAALHDLGLVEQAIEQYSQALVLDPGDALAHNNLGTAQRELGRPDMAVDAYRRALAIDPHLADAHFNLGNALKDLDRLDEACFSYLRAIALRPEHHQAQVNLGVAHKEQGRFERALAVYDGLLQRQPDFAEARFNRALVYLQLGDFAQGWSEYEWRWKQKENQRADLGLPLWDGAPLAGRTILITAEQGVGDEIMFASCLPDLLDRGAICILECDRRLGPLLARSFPQVTMIAKGSLSGGEPPAVPQRPDVVVPAGSLPRHVRRSLEDFPGTVSYLVPDAAHLAAWRERLRTLGSGLKVGISWRGGQQADVRRKRSISLGAWAGLFRLPDVHLVNLQYGDCRQEIAAACAQYGARIHAFSDVDPLAELDRFAALTAALDLVISVDNSTVHLAGALGVATWVLLPFASDWRWLTGRDDSPWYPGLRLFRQPPSRDWTTVFEHVGRALRRKIEQDRLAPSFITRSA